MVEPPDQTEEIAAAVAVPVLERLDVDAVKHGVLPP
jgi:hypothetical protein